MSAFDLLFFLVFRCESAFQVHLCLFCGLSCAVEFGDERSVSLLSHGVRWSGKKHPFFGVLWEFSLMDGALLCRRYVFKR